MTGRILVLGGTGILGRAVARELTVRAQAFSAPGRDVFDLADVSAIPSQIDAIGPAAVINLAGFTDVAAAERLENKDAASRLNAELPATLAGVCARRAIPFVHISTDYVFDGARATPYVEGDAVRPLQVYGVTKLRGEQAAIENNPGVLILRVSTLYGPERAHRPAYVDAILAQAREKATAGGGVLSVVERPVSSPTYAPDVAPALIDLLDREAFGIVHVVNDGAASRLDLARAAIAHAGLSDRVAVETRPELPSALSRPTYSVLDTSRLLGLIGRRLPAWEDGLARYVGGLRAAR